VIDATDKFFLTTEMRYKADTSNSDDDSLLSISGWIAMDGDIDQMPKLDVPVFVCRPYFFIPCCVVYSKYWQTTVFS